MLVHLAIKDEYGLMNACDYILKKVFPDVSKRIEIAFTEDEKCYGAFIKHYNFIIVTKGLLDEIQDIYNETKSTSEVIRLIIETIVHEICHYKIYEMGIELPKEIEEQICESIEEPVSDKVLSQLTEEEVNPMAICYSSFGIKKFVKCVRNLLENDGYPCYYWCGKCNKLHRVTSQTGQKHLKYCDFSKTFEYITREFRLPVRRLIVKMSSDILDPFQRLLSWYLHCKHRKILMRDVYERERIEQQIRRGKIKFLKR